MGKDAALQIFTKRLADIGLGGVVVTLAVELAFTRECMPGLEVLGDGLVQQRTFGVARLVELGLCTRWPTRKRMRVGLRRRCGGNHRVRQILLN